MKRVIFFLVTIILCYSPLRAEYRFYFKRLTIEHGLPQNSVLCILQDEQGFMWFGTKDGLCRYDGYRFRVFRHEPDEQYSLGNNFIRSLFQSSDGTIWVGTDNGVWLYDPKVERFTPLDLTTREGISIVNEVNDIIQDREGNLWFAVDWQGIFMLSNDSGELSFFELDTVVNAWSICVDDNGSVWIGTHEGGVKRFNREENRIETVGLRNGRGIEVDNIYKIAGSNFNKLLVGTARGGVKEFDPLKNQVTELIPHKEAEMSFVRSIMLRTEDEIWVGAEDGLYIYDRKKKSLEQILHNSYDRYSLSDNAIYAIYKDREGGIWIGTYFGGVNYLALDFSSFEMHYPMQSPAGIRGERVREIAEDRYGNLWIGTEDRGLSVYNPRTNSFDNLTLGTGDNSARYSNIHGLMIDGDKVWVGVLGYGIDIIDINSRQVIRHYEKGPQNNTLCNNNVFTIYRDNSGLIWVGTLYGLCTYSEENDDFTRIDRLGDTFISSIIQTNDGNVWVSTMGKGLFRYTPMTRQWRTYERSDSARSIPHNKIITLFKDSRGHLWLGTEGGGLARYDAATGGFTTWTVKDGLPNDVIYKILEDEAGRLWVTTNNGLARIGPDMRDITVYTHEDGLLSNQFNYNSGEVASDGKMYFGSPNGLIAFRPGALNRNPIVPPVTISGFALSERYADPQSDPAIMTVAVNYGGLINLNYKQSDFYFDFASLSYVAPAKNQYRYKLRGYDEDWNHSQNNQRAYYSNVKPGRYEFMVTGSNNDNVWNDRPATVRVTVHPPFYLSTAAKVFYCFLLIGAVAVGIWWYRRQGGRRMRRRLEVFESNKTKELYKSKIAFFTNIAHEIRTPVSLIKAPLEYLMHGELTEEEKTDNLMVIENNTKRLLDLINQLLDFRKTETEDFQLYMVRSDIVEITRSIFKRFVPTAKRQSLVFTLTHSHDKIFADIDIEAYKKIISNLLSNAIKNAETTIRVEIEQKSDEEVFEVRIANDGSIIPREYAEKIFEPLYQLDHGNPDIMQKGTGLGLPLSRSLSSLHNGSLVMEFSEKNMNVFLLTMPLENGKAMKLVLDDSVEFRGGEVADKPTDHTSLSDDGRKSILIAEDNKEMQSFLYKIFRKNYNVILAGNGEEALEKLSEYNIDLIISDIMMPVMDGLEFSRQVKSLLNYSHIPFIMLTAKTGVTANIEGLEAGVDAYVEKPFSTNLLKARVENLFDNRRKMQLAFASTPLSGIAGIASSKADEKFLERVTETVYEHMTDENFNVDALADKLNMSRSSLHRKIKSMSELTPNDFILVVRLKRAAELLQSGEYRINEIGYVVGFSSSSYFSKSFKKHFGLTPSEFIRKK